MNTIDRILSHQSQRQFSEQALEPATLEQLLRCAQAAATSHYVQAYSIIGITDPALKQSLAAVSGQAHALNNAHLLVFIADLNRHASLVAADTPLGNAENLLVATIDASLAAQNLTLAAESLGLGCCYLGSLRNQVGKVIELLQLPRYTFPLFGIALGYPAQALSGEQKPRLPLNEIYQENGYQSSARQANLAAYDEMVAAYYAARGQNQRQQAWTALMQDFFSTPRRQDMGDWLKRQGFEA